jgi:hypothetical protein
MDYVQLPCGCKITPTTVLAMCDPHFVEFRGIVLKREIEWQKVMEKMRETERRNDHRYYDV